MFYFSLCHPMAGGDRELGRMSFVSRRGSYGPENWGVAGQWQKIAGFLPGCMGISLSSFDAEPFIDERNIFFPNMSKQDLVLRHWVSHGHQQSFSWSFYLLKLKWGRIEGNCRSKHLFPPVVLVDGYGGLFHPLIQITVFFRVFSFFLISYSPSRTVVLSRNH